MYLSGLLTMKRISCEAALVSDPFIDGGGVDVCGGRAASSQLLCRRREGL